MIVVLLGVPSSTRMILVLLGVCVCVCVYWRLGGCVLGIPSNREIVSFRSCVRAGEAKLRDRIPVLGL